MNMYRCSLTGFFSNNNGQMVYDKNKTVILNIDVPYQFSTAGGLANHLMVEIFNPREPVGDLPLRAGRMGRTVYDKNLNGFFTFYKKDDPLLTEDINDGGIIIESNEPMSFKINKLTNEQKQADEFNSEPYLDVYDALIDFTDDQSTEFESLGYSLPIVVGQQIVFHSLGAVNATSLYNSINLSLDEIPPISCDGANSYIVIAPLANYGDDIDTGGVIDIIDTVEQTGKRYYFNNFTEFFDSQWARDTIAANHQSLIIDEASAGGYLIGLFGYWSQDGEVVNSTKITISLYNSDLKLMAMDNSSITGSGTNVISVCLNPEYLNAE